MIKLLPLRLKSEWEYPGGWSFRKGGFARQRGDTVTKLRGSPRRDWFRPWEGRDSSRGDRSGHHDETDFFLIAQGRNSDREVDATCFGPV